MEFEEARENLRAIRLLYRLLEDNSITLQNSYSEDLLHRARVLLKSLLDVAVESFFETRLKIIATQVGTANIPFEQEKRLAVLKSESPVSANISQSSAQYPTCSKMSSEKDEQPQLKLLSMEELPELSEFSISGDGGTKSKTACCIGEEINMIKHNSVKVTNPSNENGISPSTESSHHKQQCNDVKALYGDGEHAKESLQLPDAKDGEDIEEIKVSLLNGIHEAQCNSSAVRGVESQDQNGDFSDDLVNTIRRIESRILAFQLSSSLVDSTKSTAGHQTVHQAANSESPVVNQKTCKPSCKGENSISTNSVEEHLRARKESLSQATNQNQWLQTRAESAKSIDITNQIGTQMVSREGLRRLNGIQNSAQSMAMLDRIKSLNKLVSGEANLRSQASECIQGVRVPLSKPDQTKKNSMSSQTNREILVRKNQVAWPQINHNRKERSSESSYAQKLAGPKFVISRREKPPPHNVVMKRTLLDQRSSEIKLNSHQHRNLSILDRRKTHKPGHLEPLKKKILPQHHELEESSSNSDSSHLRSQQGSANSSSDSEDYSLPEGTQCPSSERMVDVEYEGSSEESSNSYLYKGNNPSHRIGSFKYHRHHHERNPKQTTGRLRRLKNKLGLIFHHHHHHHHHHHDDDRGNTLSKAGHRHSMWNHLQNVFHHKNKHGMVTKQKVDKTRRGAVAKVSPRRNQAGQFHRLVEGVLRHVRHSKKPKPSKLDGVKRSRTLQGHKKNKKLHWWQILRRHQGVKLKSKGRVKMGFISQKSLKN